MDRGSPYAQGIAVAAVTVAGSPVVDMRERNRELLWVGLLVILMLIGICAYLIALVLIIRRFG